MQMKDLRPVSQLAQRFGAKCIAYGPPGAGKTPLIQTAPRPVLCAVEPGMLSMRNAHNVPAFEAHTAEKIDDFFKWVSWGKQLMELHINYETVAPFDLQVIDNSNIKDKNYKLKVINFILWQKMILLPMEMMDWQCYKIHVGVLERNGD